MSDTDYFVRFKPDYRILTEDVENGAADRRKSDWDRLPVWEKGTIIEVDVDPMCDLVERKAITNPKDQYRRLHVVREGGGDFECLIEASEPYEPSLRERIQWGDMTRGLLEGLALIGAIDEDKIKQATAAILQQWDKEDS